LKQFWLWSRRARGRQFGRFAAFLSRGVLGGYPPADEGVVTRFWRIKGVYLRIEAHLRLYQSALADIYLALPPRWFYLPWFSFLRWLWEFYCSLLRIIKFLYSSFGQELVTDV
jgi:hypothetical protein